MRKISIQTAWQLLAKGASSLSTIIILGLIARRFGKEGTGIYTLALTYLSFFYIFSDFGFNAYLLPRLKELNSELVWRKLLGLRLIWSTLLIIVATAALPFLPFAKIEFSQSILFGAIAVIGNSVFLTANALFQSELNLELGTVASALGIAIATILVYIFSRLGAPVEAFLLSQSIGWLITGAISLFLVKKFIKNIAPLFDWQFVRKCFTEAWPVSLTLAVNLVYFRFDSFALTSIKSFTDVGIYNFAYSIFQAALVVPTFIMNGLYPLMIDQLLTNREKFFSYFKKAAVALLGISVLGTFLTIILSHTVITLLAGRNDFESSVVVLKILSLGFPSFFISSLLMWTLILFKRYKTMLLIYLVGLLFNISANLIFIPQYSYIASAWITGISECLILVIQIIVLIPILRKR